MQNIGVKMKDDHTFEVRIQAQSPTVHTVTVEADYAQQLSGGKVSTEHLVEASFRFLLEREPNTIILSQFNLKVIGHYFPEYERIIKAQLQS